MIVMDPPDEESSTASKNPVGSDNEEDDGEKKQPAEDVQEGKDAQEGDSSKRLAIAHFKPKKIQRKYKKAPNAPKRFRSAFILFSQFKHKEIQAKLAKEGTTEKTTSVAKMVSEAWKTMDVEERTKWEDKAEMDRERFEKEKMRYRGPWTVPIGHRKSRDPTAPKRPASAFLSFSNSRRAAVKRANRLASNAEISKILSDMWKDAPDDLKKQYTDDEAAAREEYKKKMTEWKAEHEKTKTKKRDPLELFQEYEEERKRKGIPSDEEYAYDYSSDEEYYRKKRGRFRRKESEDRKEASASLNAAGAQGGTLAGGNRLNELVHALGQSSNSAQASLAAPQLMMHAPMMSSYPSVNPIALAPSSLALRQLQDGRALPTFMNASILSSGLPLASLAGYPGNLGPNLSFAAAGAHLAALNRQSVTGAAQSLNPNYAYRGQLDSVGTQGRGHNQQVDNVTDDQKREQEFLMQLLLARRQQQEQKQRSQQRRPPG